MLHQAWFRMIALGMVLFALLFGPMGSAFAQTAENDPSTADTVSVAGVDTPVATEEKGEFTPGESSSIDINKHRVFIPIASANSGAEASAAATTASWNTFFIDEFCSFPTAWNQYDANDTGQLWTKQMVDGFCTAKPSGYVGKMNTWIYRDFSLTDALDARMSFSFKMNTEANFDLLRFEYTCDGGKTWEGTPHAYTGAVSTWTTKTISLFSCKGKSSVRIRFSFQTDKSVIGVAAPALDWVKVEKFK